MVKILGRTWVIVGIILIAHQKEKIIDVIGLNFIFNSRSKKTKLVNTGTVIVSVHGAESSLRLAFIYEQFFPPV